MYLHIGRNELIPEGRVIGVFDLDTCGAGKRTREFLRRAEDAGAVVDVSGELPRSFVLADHPYHDQIVYLSQLTPATLEKRWQRGILEEPEMEKAPVERKRRFTSGEDG